MATLTLTANTDYSSLTIDDDDTIDLDGFELTIDVQPDEENIDVITPGKAGTVVLSGGWDLSTWSFTSGTATIIDTVPAGAVIGSVTGGTENNVRGVMTNNGTILNCTGGTANGTHGIDTNNGTVTNATGGSGGSTSTGVATNNGTITNATGGSGSSAFGVNTNNGTVINATGGSTGNATGINTNNGTVETANGSNVSSANGISTNNNTGTVTNANGGSQTNTWGVSTNNGLVTHATGGSGSSSFGISQNRGSVGSAVGGSVANAYGVQNNWGLLLRITDSVASAANNWEGIICFVEGPHIDGEIPDNIKTIYSLGPLSENAIIAADATVIELSEGIGPPPAAKLHPISTASHPLGTR